MLGGQHGPLRLLTRTVTYAIVFGIGYGLGLELFFGLVAGVATGITVSVELNRAARGLNHYSLGWEASFSAIRGFAFGIGLYPMLGLGMNRWPDQPIWKYNCSLALQDWGPFVA